MTRRLTALLFLVALAGPAAARDDGPSGRVGEAQPAANPNVGFDEHIGAQVPLDLTFKDEAGKPITLRECVGGKPTVLVFTYYRCPMLCTQVLNGLVDAMKPMSESVGKEFNVVTVGFDPKETPAQAAQKKASYLEAYGRPGAETGWRFLTGAQTPIKILTETVGFKYEFDKAFKEYNHPSGIVLLTPEGKVSRYFYGISYGGEYKTADPARDFQVPGGATTLRLSLVEAGEGKMGSLWDRVVMSCYRFDHLSKGYALDIMRVVRAGGVLTVVLIAGTAVFFLRRDRRRPEPPAATGTAA